MSELNEKMASAGKDLAPVNGRSVNVRDFIQNYTPYEGDEAFLAGATPATTKLWDSVLEGIKLKTVLMHRLISTLI